MGGSACYLVFLRCILELYVDEHIWDPLYFVSIYVPVLSTFRALNHGGYCMNLNTVEFIISKYACI